jgi:uncharacterized protein (UPF0335 family)
MAENGEAKIGDNANLRKDEKLKLSGIISEVERLNTIIADYNRQKSEIFKTAKENGFDNMAIKHIIKLRAMKPDIRDDFQNALDAYMLALQDFITTPLGQAGLPDQVLA